MYTRIITSEQKHTLEDAKRIIDAEREEKREIFLYKAKQKLLGMLAIGISIASPLLLGDATITLFMLPLGIFLMVTKKGIIMEI